MKPPGSPGGFFFISRDLDARAAGQCGLALLSDARLAGLPADGNPGA